ncbi:MAG: hypothetical protein ACT4OX_13645 [Actinomycetota bacterium]
MEEQAAGAPQRGVQRYEWLCVGYGLGSLAIAGVLATSASLPQVSILVLLCGLSALSLRFNADGDEDGKIAASAQGMVIAAAALAFRDTSPLLGPLLVGMAAAFWRLPRSEDDPLAVELRGGLLMDHTVRL